MTFTLEQLLWSVQRGHLTVTAETSGSLVLALAEQLLPAPRRFSLRGIGLTQSGQLILEEGEALPSAACESELRVLLRQFLQYAGAEHRPLASCARTPTQSVAELLDALQHSLVPMNRAAAKRALARLHRRLEAFGPPDVCRVDTPETHDLPPLERAQPFTPSAEEPSVEAVHISCSLAHGEGVAVAPHACDWTGLDTTEGTPHIGSFLSVTPRVVQAEARALCALDEDLLTELDPELLELESTPELEGPTQPLERRCEGPRPASGVSQAFFGRFVARRSELSELLTNFTFETGGAPHRHASSLRQSLGISPERGATLTPPNVHWLPASARQS